MKCETAPTMVTLEYAYNTVTGPRRRRASKTDLVHALAFAQIKAEQADYAGKSAAIADEWYDRFDRIMRDNIDHSLRRSVRESIALTRIEMV